MVDNIILSLREIENYRGQGSGKPSGKYLRFYCPVHGGDHQRSFQLNPETGHFKCFTCGAWGYLEESKKGWRRDRIQSYHEPIQKPEEVKPRPELRLILEELQKALIGSWGEKYLERRKIPLTIAQSCGIGYAEQGKWPHPGKDGKPIYQWKWGRLVFPHTNPQGDIVNLYGRAVGSDEKTPKEIRHDHLPGHKGVFNAQVLNSQTVFICEGGFDALSLMAAGYKNSCAVFGVNGLRWSWVKAQRVVFCFDQDTAGSQWKALAKEGARLGKEIYFLPGEVFHGYKDLNELWVKKEKIDIGEWKDPEVITRLPGGESEIMATIQETYKVISGMYQPGFLAWCEKNNPKKYQEIEELQGCIEEAAENKDLGKLKVELNKLVDLFKRR